MTWRVFAVLFFLAFGAGVSDAHGKNCCQGPPPELCGSPESLAWQNEVADFYDLPRIKDVKMLAGLVQKNEIVRIPLWATGFYLEGRGLRPYALVFTRDLLEDLGARFFLKFRRPFKISSLIRTQKEQDRLVRRHRSDADGRTPERRSVHTTGSAFDISRRPFSEDEIKWLRILLVALEKEGVIEATEEMCNNAFHVMVFPWYDREARAMAMDSVPAASVVKKSPKKIKKKKSRR